MAPMVTAILAALFLQEQLTGASRWPSWQALPESLSRRSLWFRASGRLDRHCCLHGMRGLLLGNMVWSARYHADGKVREFRLLFWNRGWRHTASTHDWHAEPLTGWLTARARRDRIFCALGRSLLLCSLKHSSAQRLSIHYTQLLTGA